MNFPQVTIADWRAQVEKELAGVPFDKALVHRLADGVAVLPLYTEAPAGAPISVGGGAAPFRICTAIDAETGDADIAEDLSGGAEALWLRGGGAAKRLESRLAGAHLARTFVLVDASEDDAAPSMDLLDAFARGGTSAGAGVAFAWGLDPLGALARGVVEAAAVADGLAAIQGAARLAAERYANAKVATVAVASTVPYHDAGADAPDEIAFALATGVAYLRALTHAGLAPAEAARRILLRVAVGRDTFGELCKLRALRLTWRKVLAASGADDALDAPSALVHAVCSSRTLTRRDPWVNMLRVTTQVFAAVLGGADLITPATFDQALGAPSALGRRIARNTGLVLREESSLGKVIDPAGGSYYFDTLTDTLAREAWKRFRTLESEGGMESALASGRVRARLEARWRETVELVAKRKLPVLGVSEFANLGEKLPQPPIRAPLPVPRERALPVHRDAEAFEELRARADAKGRPPEAVLIALGPLAESRARVGFAANLFGAGGIRTREATANEPAALVCLCGTDERYAAEAVERARALKAAGCRRVLVAGRPGPVEAPLREAGADGFLFVGCDAVSLLSELLDVFQ